MSWTYRFRRRLADRLSPEVPPEASSSRRTFFRQAAGAGAAALGAGLVIPEAAHSASTEAASHGSASVDAAWAAVEARAQQFGIVPGTRVDAQGRPAQYPGTADPFIGELMYVGFGFAPRAWALCDGSLLAIAQNTALFSLLGTTYGGDGRTTFGLPDLLGRRPVGPGTGPGLPTYRLGEKSGNEFSTLNTVTMPTHTHALRGSSAPGTTDVPTGQLPAVPASSIPQYAPLSTYSAQTALTGSGFSFENRPPFLGLYVCIALQGVFPSRS